MNRTSTFSVLPHRAYGSIPQPNLLWPRALPFYSSVSRRRRKAKLRVAFEWLLTPLLGFFEEARDGTNRILLNPRLAFQSFFHALCLRFPIYQPKY